MQIQASIGLIFAVCRFWDKIGEHRYLQPFWSGERSSLAVHRAMAEGEEELTAEGFEQTVDLSADVAGQRLSWSNRPASGRCAKLTQAALYPRLAKACRPGYTRVS